MKEKPILFTAPMVKAILDGRKTQTRRLNWLDGVNEHPDAWDASRITVGRLNYMTKKSAKGKYGATFISHSGGIEKGRIHVCPQICPYIPGQRVWVRENFAAPHKYDGMPPRLIPADANFYYPATENCGGLMGRPSIHMPRWASRISLEITGVRVERLQDISYEDAISEGVDFGHITDQATGEIDCEATDAYENLWEQINGPGSWDANPWVWVIEFKRVEACQ